MARYLTLSRAARLAGVKRGALQKKISDGELPTFEGMIELSDLLKAYPDARVDDTAMLEHVDRLKSQAVPRALREHSGPPDLEGLAARAMQLSEELARSRAALANYEAMIGEIRGRLEELERRQRQTGQSDIARFREWFVHILERYRRTAPVPGEIALKDTVLRIMAAHVRVFPSGHDFFVEGRDNLLDAGLRAGYALPYGCRDGSCGQCKARLLAGRVKKTREHSYVLTEEQQREAYILMCCNTALTDTEIRAEEAIAPRDIPHQALGARVDRIDRLTEDVMVLQLRAAPSARLRFLAGQYAVLRVGEIAGAYSIASCPCEESRLHFHVRRRPASAFGSYAFGRLRRGDAVRVEGPLGEFTLLADSPRSIVFIAWDAGFAPIKSMLESALALDAAEAVHVYWITEREGDHYYDNLCRAWADALDHVHYTSLVAGGGSTGSPDKYRRRLEALLEEVVGEHADLASRDFYLCGGEPALTVAESWLRSRGVPNSQLLTEPIRQGADGGRRTA
ncbi:MAG: 2Fe-2S iron-sulfur cluster binding domain-containing protein [Gammaproteobacteria bacterium]|nr:2Fe-2S iron-sulfur cluster binding domain-containing protein [Gammaproteobacteria bacterium]NIR97109.1 2Fe-2S iron-sulfur cluster binding domain-containing protein [Gammaproteobacteria bacterium]NIT62812.1 2Fe-2S iron-sulfur cluster binding domain-containing protein [Gammaproteobacteria bacterium]NIV19777.1 2Fe-2S iron-sulfur cluster binding domain-containing protein [Gammaproteobacteria bacterium]NIX11221.1 2Fe-2S iron-sulfur cluster binding domain-containing protein [Gammaproteobacteria ba